MNNEHAITQTLQSPPESLDDLVRKDRAHSQRLRELGVQPQRTNGALDAKSRNWERKSRKARKTANASKRLQRNVARKAHKLHQKSKQSKGKKS